jgi:hypothetical protein
VRAAPPFAALGELYLRECHERAEVYQDPVVPPGSAPLGLRADCGRLQVAHIRNERRPG